MTSGQEPAGRAHVPPRQKNLDRASELAFEALGGQSDEQLRWLGAEPSEGTWRLPVLGDVLDVDLASRSVKTSAGGELRLNWRILVLHYLAVDSRPEARAPEVTFADLANARSYAGVYHERVIARLCATAGRDADTLHAAARSLGGEEVDGGDAAFQFDVFPRLSLRLVWHGPDEEFPASATLLLPPNVEFYFCSEDVVVLSECLVSRLSGASF